MECARELPPRPAALRGRGEASRQGEREGREAIFRLQERDNREDESPQGAEVGPRAHRAPPSLTACGPRKGRWNRPTPFNRRWSGATPAGSATISPPDPGGVEQRGIVEPLRGSTHGPGRISEGVAPLHPRLRTFDLFEVSPDRRSRTPAVNNNPSREIFREKVCPLIKKC